MARIDTHQHFWRYNPYEYGWMLPGMEILQKDHLPNDLLPLLRAVGIDGTVAVQARQTLKETRWLVELADQYPLIKGGVGFPEQRFVLDHIAKPLIKTRQVSPWDSDLRRLAAFPNVYCKVSGMVTEADWKAWKSADFRPYLDIVFEAFGTKRTMIGSDWPVCTVAGPYPEVMQIALDYLAQLSETEQADVWGNNAIRFYGIPA